MNNEDALTIIHYDPASVNVQHSTECVYVGMSADNKPKCNENGVEKNIQNDTVPGICGINLKRRDAVGSGTDTVAIADSSQWKLVRETECSNAQSFHGGVAECVPGESVVEWYTIETERSWANAKLHCEQENGKLISRFNSTNEHLLLITEGSNRRFWVGATDEITEG